MTVSDQNPYSAVPTGACLVCGEPITNQVRGRPRLYCERVRCRRRGARRRALAVAWEEGRVAAQAAAAADQGDAAPAGPTYEDGMLAGQEAGRAEAVRVIRLLAEKGDAFMRTRAGPDFKALDEALLLARRWLETSEPPSGPGGQRRLRRCPSARPPPTRPGLPARLRRSL